MTSTANLRTSAAYRPAHQGRQGDAAAGITDSPSPNGRLAINNARLGEMCRQGHPALMTRPAPLFSKSTVRDMFQKLTQRSPADA